MILKFYDFWSTHKPKLISTEDFVWSDEYKYAGTADLVVELDGQIMQIPDFESLESYLASSLQYYVKSLK